MRPITSFFDKGYKIPQWLRVKKRECTSRRKVLKAGVGLSALVALPRIANALPESEAQKLLATDPWLTINAVLEHLLPSSNSGPGAKEIQVTQYLMNVVKLQPTAKEEVEFIYKGVGWLNGYTQSQDKLNFFDLSTEKKEQVLQTISKSLAGENWLNNLIGYIYEAMLSPPIYGGNPNRIGWNWLEHQGGYPLPQAGNRYYELPGQIPISLKLPTDNHSNNEMKGLKRNKA